MSILDLGICDYLISLNKQKELWRKRVNDEISDLLILVEHQPVFTIGIHGKIKNLLVSETFLKQKNISLHRIERGGDITFHGPGQLVGYPIFKIAPSIINVKTLIYRIELIICKTLNTFSVNSYHNHPNIGVWVEDKKIASIGIAVKNRVTFHGFAINISTDLTYYNYINPCGMKNIKMTSVEQILKKTIPLDIVKNELINQFRNEFGSLF